MFRRSISSGSTIPRPTARARRRISVASRSRTGAWSTFESATPSRHVPGGSTTAAAMTGPASGPIPTSSTPATSRMPTRQRSVSRCGAAVASLRRRLGTRRADAIGLPGSKRPGGLSKALEQRREGRKRIPAVPAIDAVVPGEADRLRARARRREPEPESTPRSVEQPRREAEATELPSERSALDGARVAAERPVACLVGLANRLGRQEAVLEREGDALAHERVGARGVADEQRVWGGEVRRPHVGVNRKGLPGRRRRAEPGKLGGELGAKPRPAGGRQRVDPHV